MVMSVPDANTPLPQWLAYLETLHPTEIDLGLERISSVARRLGVTCPFTVITVGGTNGKGSVCAMLDAILLAGGYKVGTYTSPHLVDYNERIRINGELASDAQIVEQFDRIQAAREDTSLSYFEFATLTALLLFEKQGVDVAILEVGLGGRLDAVNMVDSDCAIITSVDIDHSNYLGTTREQIGFEKAHIFRKGCPAICADPVPPQSLVQHAKDIGADLWRFGKDFNYSGDSLQWAYGGRAQRRSALGYPALRGANQLLNASAVLAALEALRDKLVVPQHAVRLGFAHSALPGRFQILPGQPITILDVAHNPHAASALAQNLLNMPCAGSTYAVAGMLRDKDAIGTLARLAPIVDHWLCAGVSGPRALDAHEMATLVRQALQDADALPPLAVVPAVNGSVQHAAGDGRPAGQPDPGRKPGVRPAITQVPARKDATIDQFDDPVAAFRSACDRATVNDRILVFGSFATVGPVLDELGRKQA